MNSRQYYVGIGHQTKDAFEAYLTNHNIQYSPIVTDVFNLNGLVYRISMDSEAEMSLKLAVPINMCIYLNHVFNNEETA